MNIQALRGATTVEKNTPQEIITKTKVLLTTIIDKNQLSYDEIISIIFTATKDIDTQYPAVAARELGMTAIPLLCCQEMHVQGSLSRCIRVLLYIQRYEKKELKHVYLENAVHLRPDLV